MSGSSGNKVLDRGLVRLLTTCEQRNVQSAECMASYGRASPAQEHVCRHSLYARAAGLDAADHLLCEV